MSPAAPVSRDRWLLAQKVQRAYVTRQSYPLEGADTEATASGLARSMAMEKRLAEHGFDQDGVVLEVGSGAHGLIWHWSSGRLRIGVDPLAGFYRSRFGSLQGDSVEICQACGEELPLTSGCADVVLSENVIDHVQNPQKFAAELRRVARDDALVFLSAHYHHPLWDLASRVFNRIWTPGLARRFPGFSGHPFHFTRRSLLALVIAAGLTPLDTSEEHSEATTMPADLTLGSRLARRLFYKNRRLEIIARAGGCQGR